VSAFCSANWAARFSSSVAKDEVRITLATMTQDARRKPSKGIGVTGQAQPKAFQIAGTGTTGGCGAGTAAGRWGSWWIGGDHGG
jgi:hypothetical protein